MTVDEFRALLHFDGTNVEEALVRQPQLFLIAAEQAGAWRTSVEVAKESMKQVCGSTREVVKSEFADNGVRATVDDIAAAVSCHSEVVTATEAYLKARAAQQIWETLKEAVIQRGYALKEFVQLQIAWGRTSDSCAPVQPLTINPTNETATEKKHDELIDDLAERRSKDPRRQRIEDRKNRSRVN